MQQSNPQKGTVEISTIAAMAIVAAIVATASIYMTIKYLEIPAAVVPAAPITPESTPTLAPTVSPTPVPDKTADWQTYTNSKEGFEIKYPQDFKINELQDAPQVVNFNKIVCCQFSFDDGMDLQINYIPNTVGGYPDMNDVLNDKKLSLSQETFSIQKYNYGSFEGVKAVSIGTEVVKEEHLSLYLKTDNGFYSFTWSSLDPKIKGFSYINYFLPMLSTFKLTDKDSLTSKIKVFFINTSVPNDKGTVGCGDEAVGIDRIITPTATPLKAALENLLSTSQAVLDNGIGLYNSLAKQNWKLESVSIVEGEAIIKFSGKYIGFGICEDPRIKAQIEKTALQFPTVKKVSIFVGGVSLDKLTSGR